MSYCTYCGTKNRDGALFCKNCGKPMSEPKEDNNVEQPVEQQIEQPVVEQPVVEQVVATPPPSVEIPVVPPTSQPVVPQPVAPEPVTPQQAAPEPKMESGQASSDLLERVSKPRNKGRLIMILLIPLFLALAGIAVGAFFLFKATSTIKDEVSNTVEQLNEDENTDEDTAVVGEEDSDEDEAEAVEEADTETDDATTAEAEAPSAPRSMSTKAKPSVGDFQGWFINGAMKRGKPDGVRTLSTLDEISGSWKAMVFLDPSNRNAEKAQTFATLTIDGSSNERIKIHLRRYFTHFFNGNEIMDESSEAPDFFSARWKSGQLIASGVGSFILTAFWEQDGKQYAIGTFSTQDGISSTMALVRP